jgi:hypothetical protein
MHAVVDDHDMGVTHTSVATITRPTGAANRDLQRDGLVSARDVPYP